MQVHASSQQYSALKGIQKNKVSAVLICIFSRPQISPLYREKA